MTTTNCDRKCKAWEMSIGDSEHFLDCTVWPWNDRPIPASPHVANVTRTLSSDPPLTRSERVANIVTIAVAATIVITLLALLAFYFGLV